METRLHKDLEKIAKKIAPTVTKKEMRKYLNPQSFSNKTEVLKKLYAETNE